MIQRVGDERSERHGAHRDDLHFSPIGWQGGAKYYSKVVVLCLVTMRVVERIAEC